MKTAAERLKSAVTEAHSMGYCTSPLERQIEIDRIVCEKYRIENMIQTAPGVITAWTARVRYTG